MRIKDEKIEETGAAVVGVIVEVVVEVLVVVVVAVIEVVLIVDLVVVLVSVSMSLFSPPETEDSIFNQCPHKDIKARVCVLLFA